MAIESENRVMQAAEEQNIKKDDDENYAGEDLLTSA